MNCLKVIDLSENTDFLSCISASIFDLLYILHRSHIWHADEVEIVLNCNF